MLYITTVHRHPSCVNYHPSVLGNVNLEAVEQQRDARFLYGYK
jgi:hypothetical protein